MFRLALELHRQGLRLLERGVRVEQLELGPARRALAALRGVAGEAVAERAAAVEAAIARLGQEAGS
jgi:hypothetical protein